MSYELAIYRNPDGSPMRDGNGRPKFQSREQQIYKEGNRKKRVYFARDNQKGTVFTVDIDWIKRNINHIDNANMTNQGQVYPILGTKDKNYKQTTINQTQKVNTVRQSNSLMQRQSNSLMQSNQLQRIIPLNNFQTTPQSAERANPHSGLIADLFDDRYRVYNKGMHQVEKFNQKLNKISKRGNLPEQTKQAIKEMQQKDTSLYQQYFNKQINEAELYKQLKERKAERKRILKRARLDDKLASLCRQPALPLAFEKEEKGITLKDLEWVSDNGRKFNMRLIKYNYAMIRFNKLLRMFNRMNESGLFTVETRNLANNILRSWKNLHLKYLDEEISEVELYKYRNNIEEYIDDVKRESKRTKKKSRKQLENRYKSNSTNTVWARLFEKIDAPAR